MTKIASQIKTGDVFHDGSLITVLTETKCFIIVSLKNGLHMEGKSIDRKWKKTSKILMG